MTEEQVTKAILDWLTGNDWNIVCYDFPQSGTGRAIHPNDSTNEKNKGAIIPDIVAVKNTMCLFFENKNRFYLSDYEKQNLLKTTELYSRDIHKLLKPYGVKEKWFGIGLPLEKHTKKSRDTARLIDFIVCVDKEQMISVEYNPLNIPF